MAVDEQVSAIERSMETLFRLNASRKVYARRAAAAGVVISPPGLVLLRKLVELGAPSIGELARLAHMDAAATGRQVRELERDNLATRGPSDADGRVTVVRATARGRDVERRMSRVLDRHME
ncbi:MAG TPA: MarR family transcriptional regulator, partial [Acidimicrobiales bacterium]|nr:MarR family transcriptional regulator [Acidimicrobiales bacterium]